MSRAEYAMDYGTETGLLAFYLRTAARKDHDWGQALSLIPQVKPARIASLVDRWTVGEDEGR